jgi:hypothetical protein
MVGNCMIMVMHEVKHHPSPTWLGSCAKYNVAEYTFASAVELDDLLRALRCIDHVA